MQLKNNRGKLLTVTNRSRKRLLRIDVLVKPRRRSPMRSPCKAAKYRRRL